MPTLSHRTCRVLLAACLLLPQLAGAGEPASPPPAAEGAGLFFETLDVNVVNIDVYVTDRSGKRVSGLKKEDFEVYENKRPVAITNFYAVENGVAVAGLEAPAAPEVPGMPAKAEIPEDQRLRLVVYIDNFNIRPFNRNRVMRSLREFLHRNVSPDDQVMLVTYDRSLHVRRPFTSDAGAIASALYELEKLSGFAVQGDSERRDLLREIEEAEDQFSIEGRVRQHAESLSNDLEFSLDALKEIVGSLAGLPGRKALLYVSDGLPMRPGEDLFQMISAKFPNSRSTLDILSYDFARKFAELANHANANRVSFYTIDAAGLRVSSSISAENQTASQHSALIDSTYTHNLQSSLRYLADTTGGQAIVNTNDPLPGLRRVADDFDNYYSLGYTPAHSSDGRYYKVEVKVKRKGLQVRHREGYRDKTVDSRMADGTRASLYFGYTHNPLGLEVVPARMTRREDGNYLVTLSVKIPIGKLVLVPTEAVHEARARLFVSAMDRDGGMSEMQQVPVPITVPNAEVEAAKGKHWAYELTLLMRPGEQKLAVGLRDEIAATSSFVSKNVRVGAQS
jgi:VWFA-related protein